VVGILRFTDPNMKLNEVLLFGNWDYVEAARQSDKGTVTYYSVKVSNISEIDRVARELDALTANSDHETKTQSENAWASATFQQARCSEMYDRQRTTAAGRYLPPHCLSKNVTGWGSCLS